MAFKWNPFMKGGLKLDNVGSSSISTTPQSGAGNPNGVITSRFAGDEYLNTVTGVFYKNAGLTNSGREVIQTAPTA